MKAIVTGRSCNPMPIRTLHPKRFMSAALMLASLSAGFTLTGCRESAPDDLILGTTSTDALVFVKADAEETLNRTNGSSNLFKLSPISAQGLVTPLTNFTGASISDPCVSYDGQRILFSMRPAGGGARHIYEIRADGTGLRQVTTGSGPDFDPNYLPDDRILFTSSRDNEMDEYNHAPAEHMYVCEADGSNPERISYNQSDDFDPTMLPNGRVMYTRWEHFGTMNRFPLFVTNPDGTGTFHLYGPHERNFFHAQPTPDGRIIAISSTRVEEDAGPLAILKTENGPADPSTGGDGENWDVLTPQVNLDGAPWPYGSFKYPMPIGGNRYVASYSLPSATEGDVDYALYAVTLTQVGNGTPGSPASFTVANLSFLYNDPNTNEYDAQLLAPHPKPPIIPSTIDRNLTYGEFLAQDVFNRGTSDGQERPVKGVDAIDSVAVLVALPTPSGMLNNISANDFERRAILGFAPVYPDGSMRIRVPADVPISFATLDSQGRGFVIKRTHLYVRPGEKFENCFGCHEDRHAGAPVATNPNPQAALYPAHDLNLPPSSYMTINWQDDIGPLVANKCVSCHQPNGLTAAAGNLDLTAVPDTVRMNRIFPRGYVQLSGESRDTSHVQEVEPAFPRRSRLIDYVLGVGSRTGQGMHPAGVDSLTAVERRRFNLWVLMGAQYR